MRRGQIRSTWIRRYDLTYVGRIVNAAGKPLTGPINLNIDFYDAKTDGNVKGSTFSYTAVELVDGMFQVTISMSGSSYHAIFGTSGETWLQVTDTTNSKIYTRQNFFAVPYALKVPIDDVTIGYNSNGQLVLKDAAVTKLQGRSLSSSAPASGQVLKWDGSSWTPGALVDPGTTFGLGTYAADPAGLVAADTGKMWYNSTSNQIKYYDGSTTQTLGVSGSGLTSLGGQNGSTQTFAIGTSGTSPAFSSAVNVHTLHIPLASAAGVTAGLVAKADYDTFNAKQAAITAASVINSGTLTTALQNGVELKPFNTGAGNTGELRFDELTAGGGNYVGFKAPDAIAANKVWVLPNADGTADQVVKTDGGNLSGQSHQAKIAAGQDQRLRLQGSLSHQADCLRWPCGSIRRRRMTESTKPRQRTAHDG